MFVSKVLFPVPCATEESHVFPACIGWHAELGFAEKIICVSSDRSGFEHGGWYLNFTGGMDARQCVHNSSPICAVRATELQ